jgi:hypothetical protein
MTQHGMPPTDLPFSLTPQETFERLPNRPGGVLMSWRKAAAIIYAVVTLGIVAFQIALAAGAPWGAYAMGGAFPGQFPPELRIAALVQAVILVGLAVIVLARAGLVLPRWARVSRWLVWVAVAFATLSLILNLITPSEGERAIWAPTALVLLITSVIVALSGAADRSAT